MWNSISGQPCKHFARAIMKHSLDFTLPWTNWEINFHFCFPSLVVKCSSSLSGRYQLLITVISIKNLFSIIVSSCSNSTFIWDIDFLSFYSVNMDALKEGWFSEVSDMWPGVCLSFKVDKVLHAEKSKYQDIMMLQT